MKTLKFTSRLSDQILNGEKTNTWRFYDDKELTKGDVIALVNSESNRTFAEAVIDDVIESTLGGCFDDKLPGAELYESRDVALANFRRYYGDQVEFSTPVKIIRFHLRA